jgi:hypothetical protein
VIVAEFFDAGESRTLAWARRPRAAALVAQLADPGRGWDAIVVGEYERAFYGSQYASMAPLFEHYGVSLWMPEVGGRVDWHAEDHEQTMLALGLSSKREIARTRIRLRTAMAVQTREQGRYLGGRPPYGYRLADAGPHPSKAHAAWGRRAHKLDLTRRRHRSCGGCSRSGWPGTVPTGSAASSATRRQRNHFKKIIGMSYAGQPHVPIEGGMGQRAARGTTPLTTDGVQAGLCRSVRAAPTDHAARGPRVGGSTRGVPGGRDGCSGGGTAGSVRWLGCPACPGRRRAELRPVPDT